MSDKARTPITLERLSTALRSTARRDVDSLRRAAGIVTESEGVAFLRDRTPARIRAAIAAGRIRSVHTPGGKLLFVEDLAGLLRDAAQDAGAAR